MGLFVVIGFIVVFLFFSKVILNVSDKKTFEAYRKRHPELVKDGRVKCIKCGGTSIWMRQVASSPFGAKYAHTCRNCGNKLYYSKG
ncbi:MAG: hypothetical protein D6B27_08330 [Gammaproteobacteria bacterium]|nr:MAG: hypothetical protein D6B27_08330 [Gammaproteobacteria bacterium]